jgi:hypothetical protein
MALGSPRTGSKTRVRYRTQGHEVATICTTKMADASVSKHSALQRMGVHDASWLAGLAHGRLRDLL